MSRTGEVYQHTDGTWNKIDLGGHRMKKIKRGEKRFVCGITTDGLILTWGDNIYGRRGDESTNDYSIIVLPTSSLVKDICCGKLTVFVLMDDGEVFGWGNNRNGHLSDDKEDRNTPIKVELPLGDEIGCDARSVGVISSGVLHTRGYIGKHTIPAEHVSQSMCGFGMIIYRDGTLFQLDREGTVKPLLDIISSLK